MVKKKTADDLQAEKLPQSQTNYNRKVVNGAASGSRRAPNLILLLTMASLLVQVSLASPQCFFNWSNPKINEFAQVSLLFLPNESTIVEQEFTDFEVEIPHTLVVPVITNTEMQTATILFISMIQAGTTGSDSFSTEDDGSSFFIKITNLQPIDTTVVDENVTYQFFFELFGSPFEHTLDVQTMSCRTKNSGTIVSEATGSDMSISASNNSNQSLIKINLPTASEVITVSTDETETGKSATMTIRYTTTQPFLASSWFFITMPKANKVYDTGNNSGSAVSFVTATTKGQATVTVGGTSFTVDSSSALLTEGSGYAADTWAFTFSSATEFADAGKDIVITVDIANPMLVTTLLEDWTFRIKTERGEVFNGNGDTDPADWADYDVAIDANVTPGVIVSQILETTSGTTAAISDGNTGLGVTDVTYAFSITNQNAIPQEGVMIIEVPTGVTIPSNSISDFSMVCTSGCNTAGTLSYNSGSRELTIENSFTSYLDSASTISFTLKGWTNPTSTATQDFTIATFFDNGSDLYGIELFTGIELGAADGKCQVQYANVTDGDTRIYGSPSGYSFHMYCDNDIDSTMGLQIIFPAADYIVRARSSCSFIFYGASRYDCTTYAPDNMIVVKGFTTSTIKALTLIEFTIDSIINPGTYGSTGEITINTIDSSDVVQDQGFWEFDPGYFTEGNITTFTVIPQSSGVGESPVKYVFNVVPNGEIPRYGYLQIDLPDEVEIVSVRAFEDSCGEDIDAFTNTVISCVVLNSQKTIQIKDGFLYQASSNFTDDDGLYFPPDLSFTLDGFKNPRETGYSSPWNITVYNESGKHLYYWQTSDAPTIRVSGISSPAYIEPIYENRVNGALSYIEFLVTTTGGLTEGDKIVVKLPSGWQFSTDSEVLGRSNNMAPTMESTLSNDLRQVEVTIELNAKVAGQRMLQYKLASGYSFQFRVTQMKNFQSLRPATESIEYYVYSWEGVLFEEQTTGLYMVNQKVGSLDANKNGIIPGDFRTDFASNYTLTIQVANFEINMVITLHLPEEINFTEEDPYCLGLSGVDKDILRCDTDRTAKTLSFTNALEYKQSNPGQMQILIENLMNPTNNVVTGSFGITTKTSDDYSMDELFDDITINFYCEYPCSACPQGSPSMCETCYSTAVERFFHLNQCLAECPNKMVETTELTCIDCITPCVTCEGSATSCTTCIEGWYIVNGNECREEIFWYFPFVGTALIFFILISISECATKRASNFKESLIAFWSLPEVGSWGYLIYLMWLRIGQSEATALAALAALMYVCINCVHAIIHPRYMVPNTLDSYKKLMKNYACGTGLARTISYLISFKFSLVLVSNFFGSNRLKGDYSAMNWKQFNRFSLFFCLFPYTCMMASCGYFIMTDGFWSYTGFVAAEVVCLSSIMTMLLAIDAISAIKCKTVGKRKVSKQVVVTTGADYESDEDERNLKKQVRGAHRAKGQDVFGADDDEYDDEDDSRIELKKGGTKSGAHRDSHNSYRSQLSQQTQIMNDEARKQIQMLEELAHQMREEKRQLQLDKERIDREKQMLDQDRVVNQQNIEGYMEDYHRQAMVLNDQVQEMERHKIDLVQQVELRLEEGNRANLILAQKVSEANQPKKDIKNFRDFEGEMEDYEPVEEAKSSEEEEPEEEEPEPEKIDDIVQLPVLPAAGQIDYVRQIEESQEWMQQITLQAGQIDDVKQIEESQQWMQQITPRAGGISNLGEDQHMGKEDDMELAMDQNATAHYETASVPPSQYEAEMAKTPYEAVYHEMTSQMEAARSEEYQQRSDAEMEVNSEVEVRLDGHGQEYFIPERAIYSTIGDRVEKDSEAEFFNNDEDPIFDHVEKPPTRHGNEQRYFAPIQPKGGDGDQIPDKIGSTIEFFKPERPVYEDDDEGDRERHATDTHFFNPEKAQLGDADDIQREGLASPQEFMNRERNMYGDDVSRYPSQQAEAEQLFNQEQAIKDDASNIGRSQLGSEMIYQEREDAYLDEKEWHEQKQREGKPEEFMNRENALYSQEDGGRIGKNATQQQFFKHEEAVRGDVSSQDRSVAGTQQNYFKNVDNAELGRPDTYSREKSMMGSEYMNKSDLNGNSRNNQGMATPYSNKQAEPMEYMNKSEAEYGRPDSMKERNATMSKYFEQEQNPQFGRGDQFTRQAEESKEYIPTPEEDSSGRSESSEGGIANHQPFTSAVVVPRTGTTPQRTDLGSKAGIMAQAPLQGNPNNVRKLREDQEASLLASPQMKRGSLKPPLSQTQQNPITTVIPDPIPQQMTSIQPRSMMPHVVAAPNPQRQAKTILYSDKSETSVEDLMDDTPSNYNIANGRFEGKSLGLKAMLLHAKNNQNGIPNATVSQATIPVMMGGLMNGGAEAVPQQNRSPQHLGPGQVYAPGMVGAQKGIIGSQNDERQFVNNLYQSQQTQKSIGDQSSINQWRAAGPMNASRVQTIDVENSADGDNMQMRNTRNLVRTNKQYMEDPSRGQATGVSPGADLRETKGRGAPKMTKNNYFGEGGSIN